MTLFLRLSLIVALISTIAAFWIQSQAWSPHLLHLAFLLVITRFAFWVGEKTQPQAKDSA